MLSFNDWVFVLVVFAAIIFVTGTIYYNISDEIEYRKAMKKTNKKEG